MQLRPRKNAKNTTPPKNIAKKSRKITKPTPKKSVKSTSIKEVIETCSTNQINENVLSKLKGFSVRLKDINLSMPLKKNFNSMKGPGPSNLSKATSLNNHSNENMGEKQTQTV